ncbi:uncharacterized protein OCT59_018373 [Rhizophagus irregularis]|uniref:F-box domain-containing protein n=4 Tax=Rhizophagus irregularis TaxID=588596 RepID=A0A915ZGV4_9GLOM|nr:hypothetical protein GLOIN_2v1774651 [Rhizophagus irregularis DAOM 181602=DAOM 197198]EXX52533.1 hypothetical protein RirG_252280 [Rhizophagus irregularis DAOM 197198w]UZO26127.1 hypothetical protein OCT59_018373 [Rhizophagus irregularis]POG71614.1 hypothetical protein GLOIN_2v1774651 [Rhizophagus irregularis DAOM 181602=DAOM 197198]CAB4475476.1 unnamed protein product [Rhizophagus irregularis]CAB5207337.1 unnamed protein product [Rhizophagus irregularis]|eukprot:XP_025178480.1 hypothetical protein GLOIN_2v1774651 [Rhizophagus irregularis DAOM 181602=DAOM 197198]
MDQTISESSSKAVLDNTIPYLPTECLRYILSFIEDDDIQTLHSILLLNRTWCKNTVPILWKKPFTLSQSREQLSLEKIIPIYLSYLPDDFLDIPEMQNIKRCVYKRSTIFNYASYLKELDYKKLYETISEWVSVNKIFETKSEDIDIDLARLSFKESEVFIENVQELVDDNWGSRELDNSIIDDEQDDYDDDDDDDSEDVPIEYDDGDFDDYDQEDYYEEEMDGLWSDPEYYNDLESIEIPFDNSTESKKLMIAKKICLYLMNNCSNFEKLILDTRGWTRNLSIASRDYISLPCFPGATECLSNITEFVLNGEFDKGEIFNTMATYCKNIRSLVVWDTYRSASHSLAGLISAQNGLEIFTWCSGGEDSSPILWSFASQSENLICVQLMKAYTRDHEAFEALATCKNLERLKISECQLTSHHMRALENANFPRLKSIEINDIHTYEDDQDEEIDPPSLELASLIRNTSVHLQEIRLNLELHYYPGIIETIAINCPNLITFSGNVSSDDRFEELIKLLECCKKLENLVICGAYWSNLFHVDDMLPQIGTLIPESLKHLDLSRWAFSGGPLKNFLKDCNAKLKFMSLHCYFSSDEHRAAIDAYAKEKGIRVKDFHVDSHNHGYGMTVCYVTVTFDDII